MTYWRDLPASDDGLVAVVSWFAPDDTGPTFAELLDPLDNAPRRVIGIINYRSDGTSSIGPEFALRLVPADRRPEHTGSAAIVFRVGGNEHYPPGDASYHVIGSPLLPPFTDAV